MQQGVHRSQGKKQEGIFIRKTSATNFPSAEENVLRSPAEQSSDDQLVAEKLGAKKDLQRKISQRIHQRRAEATRSEHRNPEISPQPQKNIQFEQYKQYVKQLEQKIRNDRSDDKKSSQETGHCDYYKKRKRNRSQSSLPSKALQNTSAYNNQ